MSAPEHDRASRPDASHNESSEVSSNTQVEAEPEAVSQEDHVEKAKPQQNRPHWNENEISRAEHDKTHTGDGKEILQMEDCYEQLGFGFSSLKKWTVLTIIFLVQVSMNFNTSLYSNGLEGISTTFGVSEQGARCGAMIFLVLYAFGCEVRAFSLSCFNGHRN